VFQQVGKGRDLACSLEERLHRPSGAEYVLRGDEGATGIGNGDSEQFVEGPFCEEGCRNVIARREPEVLPGD